MTFFSDLNIESQFALNQGQLDEITLPESSREDFFAVGDFSSIEQLRQGSGLNEASYKTDTHQEEDNTLLKKQEISDGIGWDMNYEQQPNMDDFGGDFDVAGLNLVDGMVPEEMPVEEMPAEEMPTLDGIDDTRLQEDQPAQEEEEPPTEIPMETSEMPPSPTGQENFELEPVQAIVLKDRGRRKRKLVVDSRKQLTSDFIRSQLDDYSDTIQSKLFPPPTKKSMLWKKVASCDYLFANPTSYPFGDEIASLVTNKFNPKPPEPINVPEGAVETLRQEETDNVSVTIEESRDILETVERSEKQPTPPVDTSMPGWQEDYITDQPPTDLGEPPADMGADMAADFGDLPPIPELPDLDLPSVENRQSEEFSEEFEQQRWGKRTRQVLSMLQHGFSSSEDINFKALTKNCNRKMAASRFYTCLLLAKEGTITFDQSGPYQDIYISKGTKYEITI